MFSYKPIAMKTSFINLLTVCFLAGMFFSSCNQKHTVVATDELLNVTILGKTAHSDYHLVRFENTKLASKIAGRSVNNTYYAMDLPTAITHPGNSLRVKIERVEDREIPPGLSFGPDYRLVKISEVTRN